MAYFYGINRGQAAYQATVATSTQTKDIELQVNGVNVTDKQSIINALEKLIDTVVMSGYPPL